MIRACSKCRGGITASLTAVIRDHKVRSLVRSVGVPVRAMARVGRSGIHRIRHGVFPNCILVGVVMASSD